MKTSASYRLLRTINGCTSVARIELSATEVEGRTDIHPLWFAAATRGIDAASRAVGTRQRWWISSFLGSMVDTDDSIVFVSRSSPYKSIEQFRREMGKYWNEKEVARLERYVYVKP